MGAVGLFYIAQKYGRLPSMTYTLLMGFGTLKVQTVVCRVLHLLQAMALLNFQEEMEKARSTLKVTNITDILDHIVLEKNLGFFSWAPHLTGLPLLKTGKDRSTTRDFSSTVEGAASQEISGLILDGQPGTAIDVSKLELPITWFYGPDLPKDSATLGAFPNSASFALAVYVAQCRGYPVENLDFVFGGSTLKFFALQKNPDRGARYLVQKHGKTIFVKKAISPSGLYTQHFHEQPFQFERLVTGTHMNAQHSDAQSTHLQTMTLFRKYKVLFQAEADAMDEAGNTLEVKCGHRTGDDLAALFFQMLSNGSSRACIGVTEGAKWHLLQDLEGEEKQKLKEQLKTQSQLVKVEVESLVDLANRLDSLGQKKLKFLTYNIAYAIKTLREQASSMEEGAVYTLGFSGKTLHCKSAAAKFEAFLPKPAVMNLLLQHDAR